MPLPQGDMEAGALSPHFSSPLRLGCRAEKLGVLELVIKSSLRRRWPSGFRASWLVSDRFWPGLFSKEMLLQNEQPSLASLPQIWWLAAQNFVKHLST